MVYTIIQRRLTMDELAGLEGALIDDSESASEAGSNRPRSDDGQEEIGRERKSHSVKMLGEWISALISHRTMHDVMDGARKELVSAATVETAESVTVAAISDRDRCCEQGEAEADLKAAADVLQAKAAEAKRVQKRSTFPHHRPCFARSSSLQTGFDAGVGWAQCTRSTAGFRR